MVQAKFEDRNKWYTRRELQDLLRAEGRCYHCHQKGHTSSQCPVRENSALTAMLSEEDRNKTAVRGVRSNTTTSVPDARETRNPGCQ
jgi:hypothetical protein